MNHARCTNIAGCNGGGDDHPVAETKSTLTRAQVKAELARAVAAGDVEIGDSGETLAEEEPARYPHPASNPGLTRAQVRAELAQAIRDGDIPVGDEGRTLAERFPQKYAAQRLRDGEAAYAAH